MKRRSLPTLSVGIPAHNEGNNIAYLLKSILKQRQRSFTLEHVYVVCDGCTDDTAANAQAVAQRDSRVRVINDGKRQGKAPRLNQIYALNQSDYLFTFDGDVALERTFEIELVLKKMRSQARLKVVAAHQVPIKPTGLIPRLIYTNSILWNEARIHVNQGDHIANLYGAATLLEKAFSKSFTYPRNITADEEFLYLTAHQQDAFGYCPDTHVLCYVSETIGEIAMQGSRYWTERKALVKHFGEEALTAHYIPPYYKLRAVLIMLAKSPIFTLLAVMFNFYVHHFPQSDELNATGQWHQVHTTKRAIKV